MRYEHEAAGFRSRYDYLEVQELVKDGLYTVTNPRQKKVPVGTIVRYVKSGEGNYGVWSMWRIEQLPKFAIAPEKDVVFLDRKHLERLSDEDASRLGISTEANPDAGKVDWCIKTLRSALDAGESPEGLLAWAKNNLTPDGLLAVLEATGMEVPE